MKYAIRLICTAGGDALRLLPIEGSAGKYMSMANGPTAVMRPRTRTGGWVRRAMPVRILKLTTFGQRRWRMGVDKVQAGRMTGTETKNVRIGRRRCFPWANTYATWGCTRPSVLPTPSRMPEKPVPMARGNGARIMNFSEGGRFICLQTHFFGSAVAVILNSLH
jgi:hypothetical protein